MLLTSCLITLITYSLSHGQVLEEQRLISYSRCSVDNDCLKTSNNSFCFNNDADLAGRCKCRDGYELMTRNRTSFSCLKHAGYGEDCEKNIQCQIKLTVNAECVNGTCGCAEWAHLYTDGKCYTSVLLDEYCQNDGNCYLKDGTFGNCVSGRCTCKFDKQVPIDNGTACIDVRILGDRCNSDLQCSMTTNAVCRVTCKCAVGYTLSLDEKKCLKAATRFYESCEEHQQCSQFLQGGICNTGNCTCEEGHHGFGSRCARTAGLGGVCTGIEECIPDTKYSDTVNCVEGTCQCLPGAIDEQIGCGGSWTSAHSIVLSAVSIIIIYL